MKKNAPSIQDILAFIAVAQYASFTRAAEFFGTGKAGMGKAVQRLEEHLGTRLFQRTTRAVTLTEDGETYLEAARAAMEQLNNAESILAARKDKPNGRVRLDIPVGFGCFIIPELPRFQKQFPEVLLELSLSDKASDAVGEGWDIVLRVGELPADGEMIVRKMCDLSLGFFASPIWLKSLPPILNISDMLDQHAIVFRAASGVLRPWIITDGGVLKEIIPSRKTVIRDGRSIVDAVRAGMGIAQIFTLVGDVYTENSELVRIFPDQNIPGPPVYALIPVGTKMPLKTRVVLNFLAELLQK
ncbi:LysR family transcriptional regulator [Kosakonia sp. MUSA4]|uniref:LysR family transcriptional regulator n=1 Tax=Kosakonia sp. MUSA4 TaxID=2067958 RepID=UPI00159759BD|nr:LysR family transcriptional regulator [Kosakonia sp. MUSA4]QJT82287.1 LysR family transcriptional regulator [Kosakonia sp. MUSA4]